MNPFRLFNPLYVLKLERQVRTLCDDIRLAGATMAAARSASQTYQASISNRDAVLRRNLLTIADAMATGRTAEAKAHVDAMVFTLGGRDAA